MTPSTDFSLAALYAALDAQRQARGLSWAQATREINHQSERPISPSTVTGIRTKAVAEADGVLQMLLWLDRTPESLMPGQPTHEQVDTHLPDVPSHQILRFDTRKLHAALNAQRSKRSMTWAQVAKELGLSVSSLTHLANGGRTGFPHVMRLVQWLGQPAAQFTRVSDR